MAINFPNTPTLNQEFIAPSGVFIWDGIAWKKAAESPPEAPTDGQLYGRQDETWQPVSATTGIGDAPVDGAPYVRQDAGWVASFTQAAADARFEPIGAELRYEPIDSAYTKAEADGKYLDRAAGGMVTGSVSFSSTSTGGNSMFFGRSNMADDFQFRWDSVSFYLDQPGLGNVWDIYSRVVHFALTPSAGGVPMSLKTDNDAALERIAKLEARLASLEARL